MTSNELYNQISQFLKEKHALAGIEILKYYELNGVDFSVFRHKLKKELLNIIKK